MPPYANKTDSEIIIKVSFNSSDPEDPFPTIIPMIGTMGSFAYPSADLNDPLCVPSGTSLSFFLNNSQLEQHDGVIGIKRVDTSQTCSTLALEK